MAPILVTLTVTLVVPLKGAYQARQLPNIINPVPPCKALVKQPHQPSIRHDDRL